MATITSITHGGELHWDNTSAWVGGVLPGKADTAVVTSTFTLINESNGYHYWTGSLSSIQVDSTTGFASTSGSFYTYTMPSCHKVQITYDSIDSNEFFNCRISSSYANGKGQSPTWTSGHSGSFVGIIKNNAAVHREDSTKLYISGSTEVHVNRVIVRDQGTLVIKDNAHIALDSDATDSYIEVEDADLQILGYVTASLTGSTERNSGLIVHSQGHNYSNILVSGSSDLRVRTSVSQSTAVGEGYLSVTDTTGFGKGDFISVYHESKDDHTIMIAPDASRATPIYDYGGISISAGAHGTDQRSPSSSAFPREHRQKFKDNDETFQVVATGSNKIYVKKAFAKEGIVVGSTTISRKNFLKERGTVSDFTGERTTIDVRSGHNNFREGEKVVTDTGVIATIVKVTDKLIPYKNIDFATDVDPLQHFMIDPFIGSGSGVNYTATSHLITGSYGLSITTGNDSYGDAYGTVDSRYRRIFLKDTKLRDVKVTISGSQFGGPEGAAYDGDKMVGVQIRQCPYLRTRVRPFYSPPDDSQGPYIGLYSDDVYFGTEPDDYLQIDTDGSQWNDNPQRSKPSSMTIDALRLDAHYTWNGFKLATTKTNHQAGGVTLSLRGYDSSIRSMVVEEYIQELLLDTTSSIPTDTKIYRTGAKVAHPNDQEIVKIAYSIKDTRGYKNLGGAYAEHTDYTDHDAITDIAIPTFWSNQGNKTQFQDSSSTDNRARVRALFELDNDHDVVFRTSSTGDQYFELNLGKPVTFDAVSILGRYFNSTNSRTATLNGFGVEYSNDGHTWTVAKAQANDTRKPRGEGGHRLFTFTAVTGRFIRIRVNGGSASTNNYINHLGIYNFNGRGNTLELHNTLGLNVGDTISIINHLTDPGTDFAYVNYGNWRTNAKAGSETTDDYVGGWDHNFKITAVNGNVITLDKAIEGKLVFKDDVIVKLNRSITVKSDNYIPFGPYYSTSHDEIHKIEFYNTAVMNQGSNSREYFRNYSHPDGSNNLEIANCVFNYMEYGSNYENGGRGIFRNNTVINHNTFSMMGYRKYDTHTFHGNVLYGYYPQIRIQQGIGAKYTGNLIFSTRYMLLHYHSGPDFVQNSGINIVRGNYFRVHEYMEIDPSDLGANTLHTQTLELYENKWTFGPTQAYFRETNANYKLQQTPHKFEYPEAYPFVYTNQIRQIDRINLPINYQVNGNDGGLTSTLTTRDPNSYYLPNIHIGNNRGFIIKKEGSKNEFEAVTSHAQRNLAAFATTAFHVHQPQTIKINVSFDHYSDLGTIYNTRSVDASLMFLSIVGPNGRTIGPGTLVPYNASYETFTLEKEFAASPGEYRVVLSKYSALYGGVFMYYKNMYCTVKGSKPQDIHIYLNSFQNWELLNDASKMEGDGGHKIGTEPVLDNPQRTTIRMRKIRF